MLTFLAVFVAAISAIPKIVCETIHALELHDETPSWKIMDNKGRVTVVLHWDQRQGAPAAAGGARLSPSRKPDRRPSLLIQTSVDKGYGVSGGGKEGAEGYGGRRYPAGPQITVINHDEAGSGYGRLSRQGSSLEGAVHVHTAECARRAHRPSARPGSPPPTDGSNGLPECDFHCCALHEEGRKIAVHKSVATSPIQEGHGHAHAQTSPQPSAMADAAGRRAPAKGHVRFLDAEGARRDRDSSESETENTVMEDEVVTSDKFLLLIDQLSVDQKRHLTIKDIGIILERLSSKILDVERLDRESESDDCYNWTIKATIRGDVLRELGVIYNGNYYAISEHPGYKEENEEGGEEAEEEEEEDRL